MKTILKRIITVILCAVIAITGIGAGTAYAAGKKVPLKVVFNGASVNLIKDLNSGDSPKIQSLEKKWGKPDQKKKGAYYMEYVWKKGKTSIKVTDQGDGNAGGITIDINDKNGAMCGIKVGMEKETALKKLQKIFGKKNVFVVKEGQSISSNEDGSYTVEGEPTGDGEFISIMAGYMPFGPELKDGKVSSISFWRS